MHLRLVFALMTEPDRVSSAPKQEYAMHREYVYQKQVELASAVVTASIFWTGLVAAAWRPWVRWPDRLAVTALRGGKAPAR
jgi:hypothetical protein